MGDPEFGNNETLLLRTPGINVKSIPFEGVLTDQRVILIDRARNVLPPRDIPLATVRQVVAGENAIRDPTITFYVAGNNNETRQMVLTFMREAGGNRVKERDEWLQNLEYYIARARAAATASAIPPTPPMMPGSIPPRTDSVNIPKKRIIENMPREETVHDNRIEIPAPFTHEPQAAAMPETIFCIRCGNRVSTDSAFCNRCGAPVIPPAASPYAAPDPVAPAAPAPVNVYTAHEPPAVATRRPDAYPAPDAARIPPQEIPRAAADPLDRGVTPSIRKSPEPAPSEKPRKQGFIPRLFSPKARSASRKSEPPAPVAPEPKKPRRSGRSLPWKKIFLAVGVLVLVIAVIAVGVLVVYPMISKGGSSTSSTGGSSGSSSSATPAPATTSSTGQGTLSAQTSWTPLITAEPTTATVPSTGVQVHISYLGGWKGTYGLTSSPQTVQSSGDRVYEIVNATGAIQASFAKTDSSTKHDIVVEIYKDGKLLTKGSTSAAYGKVTLAADATTGVVQPAVTSASGATTTTQATNATVKITPNTTTKTTTTVTATKTTAKAS